MSATWLRKSGFPRFFRDHRKPEAVLWRRALLALNEQFDLSRPLARQLAAGVALSFQTWTSAARELDSIAERRAKGTGRRPGARDLERARRRAALEWGSYLGGLQRLEAIAGKQRKLASLEDLLARPGGR